MRMQRSENAKNLWNNPEYRKKVLKRKEMSSLEIKMNEIILKNNLPYKFVGHGDFCVGRKNPDFINVNGEKIAIEVYCKKHKNLFGRSCEDWKISRQHLS